MTPWAKIGPYACLGHGFGNLIRQKVAVAAGRYAAQQHFGTRQLHGPGDVFSCTEAGFNRKHVFLEPLFQRASRRQDRDKAPWAGGCGH